MKIGDLVITPQETLVRIVKETDSGYEPAEYDFGQLVAPAWGYVLFLCSDGNEYEDRELIPVEYPS